MNIYLYLRRHVLDLNELPAGIDVTDLNEPSGRGTCDGLLLLVEAGPLGDWLRHGHSLAGTLLTGRGWGDVEPEGEGRQREVLGL